MSGRWKLTEARTQFSRLIRDAQREPQIILRHGRPVVVVTAFRPDTSLEVAPRPMFALEALRGDLDFTAFPSEDWLERDRRLDPRDPDWSDEPAELL